MYPVLAWGQPMVQGTKRKCERDSESQLKIAKESQKKGQEQMQFQVPKSYEATNRLMAYFF